MKFSEYFGLNKKQCELDFVDIPIDNDIALFVDPYAIRNSNDIWCEECNDLIVDYFETVLNAIINDDTIFAKKLLNNLNEPKEIHFGVGEKSNNGNGVSGKQANDLYKKISKSKAAKSGLLTDICDFELMVPGIGYDKVSDIVVNIIRSKLIEYTQEQCKLFEIETIEVPSGKTWNPTIKNWSNDKYVSLPVVNDKKIILVPKRIAVYKMTISFQDYYNHEILEYLQSYNISAMTSLVEILKNGKKRVTKKKLKEQPEYRMSKEFIQSFTNKHSSVLIEYKNRKKDEINCAFEIDNNESKLAESFISELSKIKTGTKSAAVYHNYCLGLTEFIFWPHLSYPKKEDSINEGRKRIDITYSNGSNKGFWNSVRTNPQLCSQKVMIECKNYESDISNPELDQMSGRFSPLRGKLGIIMCRRFNNKDLFIKRCRDTANDQRGVILCIDDFDVIMFLNHIKNNERHKIDDELFKMLDKVITNND